MARRIKVEEPPANTQAWMATFSDLMNLLLCFFVLLFSMSSVDSAKYAELVQSLNASFNKSFDLFSNNKSDSIIDNQLFPSSVTQIEELEKLEEDTGEPEDEPFNEENFDAEAYMEQLDKEKAEALYADVSQLAEKEGMESEVEISIDAKFQYVKLTLSGGVLFDSGKSTVKKESYKVLNKIGDILKNYETNIINIEGHTDNQPISSAAFADNMELSSARAYSVWKYLVDEKNLKAKSLKAAGRSEYEPVADNTTAEGRAKNRRVEFKIYTETID